MAKRSTDNPPSPAIRKAVATIKRLLVNRTDRFGSYFVQDRGKPEERVCPFTAPGRKKINAAKDAKKNAPFLGEWQLFDHVELALIPRSPIGVHTISEKDTCKWIALDIDRHSDDIPLEATRAARIAIHRFLQKTMGLVCLVEDSGGGGWHIWVPFTGSAPARDAFTLATVARAVGKQAWLDHDPVPRIDRYPTSPSRYTGKAGLGGGWLRLPGRHPKRNHKSNIRLKTKPATGLLIWQAFVAAAKINTAAKWRAAMRKASTISAEQRQRRKRKSAKSKAGMNGTGKDKTQAHGTTQAEERFKLDGWKLDRLVATPLRSGERRLRELRIIHAALNDGLSYTDTGNAIRTLYAKAPGKSADLALPSIRAELLDDVTDLVVRLAESADYKWASYEQAQAVRQRYFDRVTFRHRRGLENWSLVSFTNWLGAFYDFLRTRAEQGGYAFLASTIATTGDADKAGAYYLKQNGGAKASVRLGRSPVKTALGYYSRRNGKVIDEPKMVTGYIAWLHILATTPLDDEHEDRTGVTVVRSAVRGLTGWPIILDCSALPLDKPRP